MSAPDAGSGAQPERRGGRLAVPAEYSLVVPILATRLVYMAVLTLLPTMLVLRGLDPGAAGFIVGLYGFAAVGTALVGGSLADQMSPKKLATFGIGGVILAVAGLSLAVKTALVAVARLGHGVAMGVFRPSVQAFVLSAAKRERHGTAIAMNQFGYIGGTLLGPLWAGLASGWFGTETAMLSCVVIAALAALYLVFLVPDVRKTSTHMPLRASLLGLPRLMRQHNLSAPMLLALTDLAVFHLWLVYLPIYLTTVHGMSLAAAGALISVEALFYALAQPMWGRILDRPRGSQLVALAFLVYAGLIAAIPLLGGDWVLLAILLAVAGVLDAGVYPGAVVMASRRTEEASYGRAMGLVSASSDLGQSVGPFVGSAVITLTGLYGALFPFGVVIAVVGLVLVRIANRADTVTRSARPD
jgi:MFS family permease